MWHSLTEFMASGPDHFVGLVWSINRAVLFRADLESSASMCHLILLYTEPRIGKMTQPSNSCAWSSLQPSSIVPHQRIGLPKGAFNFQDLLWCAWLRVTAGIRVPFPCKPCPNVTVKTSCVGHGRLQHHFSGTEAASMLCAKHPKSSPHKEDASFPKCECYPKCMA